MASLCVDSGFQFPYNVSTLSSQTGVAVGGISVGGTEVAVGGGSVGGKDVGVGGSSVGGTAVGGKGVGVGGISDGASTVAAGGLQAVRSNRNIEMFIIAFGNL
jgi:hypothetical protein